MNSLHLKRAVKTCQSGGVIAYPTEAVFGLGCLPLNEHSVERILILKQRSVSKGLILVAATIKQLETYVDFSEIKSLQTIYDSWPGPVTWIIPAKSTVPSWLTGEHETLAVRVSSHSTVRALCSELGPIVSTSANPNSAIPAKTNQQVRSYFGTKVDYVIPANITNVMNPSEIRDGLTGNIVRSS